MIKEFFNISLSMLKISIKYYNILYLNYKINKYQRKNMQKSLNHTVNKFKEKTNILKELLSTTNNSIKNFKIKYL